MTQLTIKKATKKQRKLRMALTGPSGSGKTLVSLIFAQVLAGKDGKILVVDSEHASASLYSGPVTVHHQTENKTYNFDFDCIELDEFSPQTYISAIKLAVANKYDVLIIDSLSHAWSGKGGVLEQVDAKTPTGGNSFQTWGRVGTPLQNQLIDTILSAPIHVIMTMRVKTDYVIEERTNKEGKAVKVPKKVGLGIVQRDTTEYEADLVLSLDIENRLTVSKSRCPELDGEAIVKPDGAMAETIKKWLSSGDEPAPPVVTKPSEENILEVATEIADAGDADKFVAEVQEVVAKPTPAQVKRIKQLDDQLEFEGESRNFNTMTSHGAATLIASLEVKAGEREPEDGPEYTESTGASAEQIRIAQSMAKRLGEELEGLDKMSGPVISSLINDLQQRINYKPMTKAEMCATVRDLSKTNASFKATVTGSLKPGQKLESLPTADLSTLYDMAAQHRLKMQETM